MGLSTRTFSRWTGIRPQKPHGVPIGIGAGHLVWSGTIQLRALPGANSSFNTTPAVGSHNDTARCRVEMSAAGPSLSGDNFFCNTPATSEFPVGLRSRGSHPPVLIGRHHNAVSCPPIFVSSVITTVSPLSGQPAHRPQSAPGDHQFGGKLYLPATPAPCLVGILPRAPLFRRLPPPA